MRWAALGVDFEMFGKDHQTNAPIYDKICEILGGRRARALRLRAVPRRERREDLEVEGQRPDHRRVAHVRVAREPGAVHVPAAAKRQEALFRCHPARGRRVSAVARRLSAPGRQGQARQCGVAHPRRRAAGGRDAAHVRAAAQSGRGVERRRTRAVLWGFIRGMCRALRPRRIRCSISSLATRCATTPTS